MKADTLREMSTTELDTKAQELREQLLKLRFQQSTGQIESPQMLRGVRKDIARIMTVRREKELGTSAAPAATPAAEESSATESAE